MRMYIEKFPDDFRISRVNKNEKGTVAFNWKGNSPFHSMRKGSLSDLFDS